MGITFSGTPKLFGHVHLLFLLFIVIFNIFFYFCLKLKKEETLIEILHYLGLFMILMEIFKQYFCFVYVFDNKLNLWFFPWQLCSMAMYCSFAIKYSKKEKLQNAFLVFLATFSLFSDIVALALPYDMLRDQIVLTVHSFLYHGFIITEGMIALLILKQRKIAEFLPCVFLFLTMAIIAEIINVVSHLIFNDIYVEPNMFYITLSYPSTQPVFHDIALALGIPIEIVIYLSSIILCSFVIWKIENKTILSGNR
ncbi:MAG: YwaF family protein [Erysipelotrichaceae bacterium]|nr:YwaF family protein [Erysipelotrichaceae bacterium]